MIMQDKLEKERNDAKNNVEEYVYDMRDKLHGLLEKYVSESVSKLLLPHTAGKSDYFDHIGILKDKLFIKIIREHICSFRHPGGTL